MCIWAPICPLAPDPANVRGGPCSCYLVNPLPALPVPSIVVPLQNWAYDMPTWTRKEFKVK